MSANGYKRLFSGVPSDFRCWPESRPSWANVRFPTDFVRLTPRSRPTRRCPRSSAFDPKRTPLSVALCWVWFMPNRVRRRRGFMKGDPHVASAAARRGNPKRLDRQPLTDVCKWLQAAVQRCPLGLPLLARKPTFVGQCPLSHRFRPLNPQEQTYPAVPPFVCF